MTTGDEPTPTTDATIASTAGNASDGPASGVARNVTRSERGEKKRREVLEATLRLLAREGPRAVTHRAVALEAKTSVRATTYYFESREALLDAALRFYAESAIARFDAIALVLEGEPQDPLGLAATLLSATVASDLADEVGGLVAEFELVLEIARRPGLEATYRAWQGRLETLLARHARWLGSKHPELDARLVLATLRGIELEALSRPSDPPSPAEVHALFERLLKGIGRLDSSDAPGELGGPA